MGWGYVHLVRRPLIGLLYQPRMIDDECGAVGGMRTGRVGRSTRRKPAPVPFCPPQIPPDQGSNRAAEVGSRRLTAWAMARLFWRYNLESRLKSLTKNHENVTEEPGDSIKVLSMCVFKWCSQRYGYTTRSVKAVPRLALGKATGNFLREAEKLMCGYQIPIFTKLAAWPKRFHIPGLHACRNILHIVAILQQSTPRPTVIFMKIRIFFSLQISTSQPG
jgi:hypothetical protein